MVKKMQVIKSRIRLFTQLGLAGLVMVVLIAISDASPSSEPRPKTSHDSTLEDGVARRVEALYAGIPQRGVVLGEPDAPATLQFFADLECEEARQFVIGALPFLVRRWVRGGDLRIVYRANPEETIWFDIYNHQQVATLAAGAQGKAWNYLDFFYHEQGPEFTRYATDHFLREIAEEVEGLDMPSWVEARHEPGLTRHVQQDREIAHRYSIRYTPAFLVGPTGAPPKPLRHFSLTESAAFDEAIEGALSRTSS